MLEASARAARRHCVTPRSGSRPSSMSAHSPGMAADNRPRAEATCRHTSGSRSAHSVVMAAATARDWKMRTPESSPR
jgi:hypothetical protein